MNTAVQQSDTNNSNRLLCDLIAQQIRDSPQQRIPFAEYMDLALYNPQQGYYATNVAKIGAAGDFFTSPHLGRDFGELLAEQLVEMWQVMGQPVPFTLVEMGAGQGLIAADLLCYVQSQYPDFFAVLEYVIVEKAIALIAEQQQRLQDFVTWGHLHWSTLEEIELDSIVGCCFSNELVDAFPVQRVVIANNTLQELYVSIQDPSSTPFAEVIAAPSTPRLAAYFDLVELDLPSSAYPEGYRSEVNLAALDWISAIAARLRRGYLLTIDYGYTAAQYYNPARSQGTLQCHYRHTTNDDPYSHVGQQDLTAHVDFTALERQGALSGLEKVGFTQQGLFLMALGLGDRLAANNQGENNLSLSDTLRRREALHLLINPLGLGGFGVLIQCKGLKELEKTHPLQGLSPGLR